MRKRRARTRPMRPLPSRKGWICSRSRSGTGHKCCPQRTSCPASAFMLIPGGGMASSMSRGRDMPGDRKRASRGACPVLGSAKLARHLANASIALHKDRMGFSDEPAARRHGSKQPDGEMRRVDAVLGLGDIGFCAGIVSRGEHTRLAPMPSIREDMSASLRTRSGTYLAASGTREATASSAASLAWALTRLASKKLDAETGGFGG